MSGEKTSKDKQDEEEKVVPPNLDDKERVESRKSKKGVRAYTSHIRTISAVIGTIATVLILILILPNGAPPEIISFDASPPTIDAGESSTLNWHVTGSGITVRIAPIGGGLPLTGEKEVSPAETTTYTLTPSNKDGNDSKEEAEVAHRYYELKKKLAAEHRTDKEGYEDAKTSFIKSVEEKARAVMLSL